MNDFSKLPQLLAEFQKEAELNSKQIKLAIRYFQWVFAYGFDLGRFTTVDHRTRPVAQIKDGEIINTFDSLSDAARAMHVHKNSIVKAASGRMKTCKGYQWKYIKKKPSH